MTALLDNIFATTVGFEDYQKNMAIGIANLNSSESGLIRSKRTVRQTNTIHRIVNKPGTKLFAKALLVSGLLKTIENDEDITMFIPVDRAFELFKLATTGRLIERKESVTRLVQMHTVEGKWHENALRHVEYLTTLAGTTISIDVYDEQLRAGDATVLRTDDYTRNTILHTVDNMISPPPDIT